MILWKKLIIWPSSVIVFLVVLFYLINAFDQELDPDIPAFIDFSKDTVLEEENAYFSLLGFNAAPGRDVHRVGVMLANAAEKAYQADPNGAPPDTGKFLGSNPLRFAGDASVLCGHREIGCLEHYDNHVAAIRDMLSTNRALVDRYYDLYRYPRFKETIAITVRSLVPTYPNEIHKLLLAKVALEVQRNRLTPALEAVQNDMRFWRMVLRDCHDLISKAVAAAYLQQDVFLLSDIIRSRRLDNTQVAVAQEILRPLNQVERDMSGTVRREFTMTVQLYQRLGSLNAESSKHMWRKTKSQDVLARPLFNANATINMAYEMIKDTVNLASLPAHEFMKRIQNAHPSEPSRNPLHYIYNPLGKILFAMGQPEFSPYIGRLHNLDALIRLVGLQLEIKRKGIGDEDIGEFQKGSDPDYHNPYMRKPMQWDPEKRTLSFKGIGRKRGTIESIQVDL